MYNLYTILCVVGFLLVVFKYDDETTTIDSGKFLLDIGLCFLPPIIFIKYFIELKGYLRCRN